jgi:hypothetical protein
MTPYETAMDGIWSRWREGVDDGPGSGTDMAAARAAPIVPEDNANAVDELRPSASQLHYVVVTYGSVPRSPYRSRQGKGYAKRYCYT